MKKTNRNKGITLIALIITIIVMLILVAIVLNMAVNGNLFNYAGKASLDTEIAKEKEFITLAYSETNMKKQLNENIDFSGEFEDALIRHSNGRDVHVSQDEYGYIVEFRDVNRIYNVNENGEADEIVAINDETPGELAGGGTQNNPYKVQSIEDLVVLSIMVNGGDQSLGIDEDNFEGEYISLEKSLNFKSRLSYCDSTTTQYDTYLGGDGGETLINQLSKGNGFRSIGTALNTETLKSFRGTFLGNNNKLINIYISDQYNPTNVAEELLVDYSRFGLFGYTQNATIDGLIVTGTAEIDYMCGGIVGLAGTSTISNCSSSVNYTRNGYIGGGLIGYSNGSTIEKCDYKGIMNLSGNIGNYIGGLIGYSNNSNITDCINYGTIITRKSEPTGYFGGVIGYIASGSVDKCINKGTMDIYNSYLTGGIGGLVSTSGEATITNCSNEKDIKVTNDPSTTTSNTYAVGGILGYTGKKTNMTSCVNTGNINTENILITGGIVGRAGTNSTDNLTDSTYTYLHNKGTITVRGTAMYAGGILGTKTYIILNNCFNEGPVEAQNSWNTALYAGGISGIVFEYGLICSSYNIAPIKCIAKHNALVGGIVGYQKYSFMGHCYNTGTISGIGINETNIGGLAGTERAGQVFGCYNKGEVHPLDDYACANLKVGGLIGMCYYTMKSMNAYNFGNIVNTPDSASVGGTYGWRYFNSNGENDITAFYYETHTWPGTSYDVDYATAVESIDKEQMIAEIVAARLTLGRLGFTDIEPNLSAWVIDENVNDGYPILSWQQQQ